MMLLGISIIIFILVIGLIIYSNYPVKTSMSSNDCNCGGGGCANCPCNGCGVPKKRCRCPPQGSCSFC
jgi:hypothetical protein